MEALIKETSLDELKVFEVRQAKVPILKVKYRDRLSLDISLGIVTNESLHLQVS